MSGKNTTLTRAMLEEALEPISKAIQEANLNQTRRDAQISELYKLVTELSVKFDMMHQSTGETSSTTKPAAKKTVKKTKVATDDTSATDDATAEDEPSKSVTKSKEVQSVAKKTTRKLNAAPIEDSEDTAEETPASIEPKRTVKTIKKVAKKPAEPVKKNLNKMEYFNKMFDEDEEYFNTYITDKVKAEIQKTNAKEWKDKNADELRKARRSAYYHYMKNNHDDKLKTMKEAYLSEINTEQDEPVDKEEIDD